MHTGPVQWEAARGRLPIPEDPMSIGILGAVLHQVPGGRVQAGEASWQV